MKPFRPLRAYEQVAARLRDGILRGDLGHTMPGVRQIIVNFEMKTTKGTKVIETRRRGASRGNRRVSCGDPNAVLGTDDPVAISIKNPRESLRDLSASAFR